MATTTAATHGNHPSRPARGQPRRDSPDCGTHERQIAAHHGCISLAGFLLAWNLAGLLRDSAAASVNTERQPALDFGRWRRQHPWQMQRQPLEEVAISAESGAVSALGRECKMAASNNFHKSPHRFVRIFLVIVIHEQPVVF